MLTTPGTAPTALAHRVLMVRPTAFGHNPETALDNAFQLGAHQSEGGAIQEAAAREFDAVVAALESHGVAVQQFADLAGSRTPDSLFPNNWFCTVPGGGLCLFPMRAANRRLERREDIKAWLAGEFGPFADFTDEELLLDPRFLEGTGSMVIDWEHRRAYASLSPRTDEEVLRRVCAHLGLTPMPLHMADAHDNPYYHTNVVMAFAPGVAVLCIEALLPHPANRAALAQLADDGLEVLAITREQVLSYCGNVLCLAGTAAPANPDGGPVLVMSRTAHDAFTQAQRERLAQTAMLCVVDIPTIERVGGGGVRCMLAELW